MPGEKKLVRRVAPHQDVSEATWPQKEYHKRLLWYEQGLADLAAERHAVGCTCARANARKSNACSTIVRKLAAFEAYEAEVEG